jgi:ATP-binding cassette subfamily B multidrug efflux pump
MGLILGMAGMLWLWSQGQVGAGAVAAATAMALRLRGMSHWIMWKPPACCSGARCRTASTPVTPAGVVDAPAASTLAVPQGEVRFENVSFVR